MNLQAVLVAVAAAASARADLAYQGGLTISPVSRTDCNSVQNSPPVASTLPQSVGYPQPYDGSQSLPGPGPYPSEPVPAPEPAGPPAVGSLPQPLPGLGNPPPYIVDSQASATPRDLPGPFPAEPTGEPKTYNAYPNFRVSYSTKPPHIQQASDSTGSNPYVCSCGRVYNTDISTPAVASLQEQPTGTGVPDKHITYPQTTNLPATYPTVEQVSPPASCVCSCGRVYNPASSTPVAAQTQEQLIGTAEVTNSQVGYPTEPAQVQRVSSSTLGNPSYVWPCGHVNTNQVLPDSPEPLLGADSISSPVSGAQEYIAPPKFPITPPNVSTLEVEPPTNIPETTSHIMKIPKKCDSNSITITVNAPDSSSSLPAQSSVYTPAPSTPLSIPSRPFYYTQQPPLFASCPAAVFYPATIPYVYPSPYTCPAHPSTQPSIDTYTSFPTTQPVVTSTSLPSSAVTVTTTAPKNDGSNVASFTSKIEEPTFYKNVTSDPSENKESLSPFKLLSEAVSKIHEEAVSTTPSPDLEVDTTDKDCSMPSPPVTV